MTSAQVPGSGTRSQRWLARLSFALAGLAIVIVAVFAELKSLAMLAVGLGAAAVSLAAAFFFLTRRGILRWLSLVVFGLAPIAVIVVYAFGDLLWVATVSAAAWLLAIMTARAALAGDQTDWRMPERPALPHARHPYLIMNPKSGGGKVAKFNLKQKAEELGAEVFLMDGSEPVDVAEVARKAVAKGADLLGVAGGDGTQALVAGIAAEHDIPFMVITAGTRNHFALDLGLDRGDPAACLGALHDGVELRVDLGVIGGQTFVNNASFGAYAEVVETTAYRDDKLNTTLNLLPDLLQGHRGARLAARADGVEITVPQALLVANNPYGTGDIVGLSRRARLDSGLLGVVGVKVSTARQAVSLLQGTHGAGLSVLTAKSIEITADAPVIPVGIDGEAVSMPTPVRCEIRPGALRVRVPRDRPGVIPPRPPVSWARLRQLAGPRKQRTGTVPASPARADSGQAVVSGAMVLGQATPVSAGWRPPMNAGDPLDDGYFATFDVSKPNVARVYDAMLGGKDNFAADRDFVAEVVRIAPKAPLAAKANRAFLRRVVRCLVGEAGITQLLDLGSGLPTQGNVSEVAHEIDPAVHVVHVDNDPIVYTHSKALLADASTTDIVVGDVRRPAEILGDPIVRSLIDFGRPVGLLLFAILHHIEDRDHPERIVAQLRDAVPSGSYLAISSFRMPGPELAELRARTIEGEKLLTGSLGSGRWREEREILTWFGDWELIDPGLVSLAEWRSPVRGYTPEPELYHSFFGGVARKR